MSIAVARDEPPSGGPRDHRPEPADLGANATISDLGQARKHGPSASRRLAPPPVVIIYSAFEYFTPDEVRSQVGSKVFRSLQKPVAPARLISAVADAIEEPDGSDD